MPISVDNLLRLADEELPDALKKNAQPLSHMLRRTTLAERDTQRLAKALNTVWPAGGFARAFERSGDQISAHDGGAWAWLFLGPALDAPVTAAQWADIATSGVLFTETSEWLRRQYTAEGAVTAAKICRAQEPRTWYQLLASIPTSEPLLDEVIRALVENLRRPGSDGHDFDLAYIGTRLAEAEELGALQALSQNHAEISQALLPARAQLGDADAAETLLLQTAVALEGGVRVDRDENLWLGGVRDGRLLPLLFRALEAELRTERDDPFGIRNNLIGAINRIGGEDAVRRYDELIERSTESPFKFLRIARDELVQNELQAAGQLEAEQVATRIGVPLLRAVSHSDGG